MIEQMPHLWPHWMDILDEHPELDRAIGELFAEIDEAVAEEAPTCWQSGNCCHFETYEHSLLATGIEIAWVLKHLTLNNHPWPEKEDQENIVTLDGCPFQIDEKCTIHAVRPMGCRIYFCDPEHQAFQNPLYEEKFAKLKDLHEQYGVTYRLMEWRRALQAAFKELETPSVTGPSKLAQSSFIQPTIEGESAQEEEKH